MAEFRINFESLTGGNVAKKKQEAAVDQRNINSGALFVNDKGGNEKRPDKTGKLIIDVEDFTPDENGLVTIFLAAWVRESDRVGEYLSIKAQPPQEQQNK